MMQLVIQSNDVTLTFFLFFTILQISVKVNPLKPTTGSGLLYPRRVAVAER